jgi:iron complex transport system substrate-binding protein
LDGRTVARWLAVVVGVVAIGALGWWLTATPFAPEHATPATPSGPPRLVSLSPPITQAIVAIGAADQLVGRSAWDHGTPEVDRLPSAGSALTPDLEAVARLRPTLVLTEATAAGPVDQLRAIAPVEVLPWLDVAEATASIRRLGELTGHRREAEAEATKLASTFATRPAPDAPRVLLVLGADDLNKGEVWYVKPNSVHGSALAAAGFRNAIEGDVEGEPRLSAEELVRLDPDAIVVLLPGEVSPEQRAAAIAAFDQLGELRAVREHRIEVVSGEHVMDTGPGVAALVGQLREAGAKATGAAPE